MNRDAYRIIDANFNRAREAVRVMEEFCRFALNNCDLTARAKQLRHELCGTISKLNQAELLTARDVTGDVGVGSRVDNQMSRSSVYDSFTAACKRLPEALRVVAETLKPINAEAAGSIETLRYQSYTLEKDIVMFYSAAQKFEKVRLYVVITNDLPADILNLTEKCITGGADCIQLRAKQLSDDQLFYTACKFVKLCKSSGVISIINDRVDIAVAADADGVHLGQNDLPVERALKLAPAAFIVGKSTHNMDHLKKATEERPTYAALGPVFATATKPGVEAVGLDYVAEATEFLRDKGIAGVAIGGINIENTNQVCSAGAATIAVCSAVTHAADVADACRNLKAQITVFLAK